MSNDLKLWIARFGLGIFIVIDFLLIEEEISAVMSPGHSHLWFIVGLLVLSLLLSLPVALYYHIAKAKRWESSLKDQNQIAVETLAKIGEERRKKH